MKLSHTAEKKEWEFNHIHYRFWHQPRNLVEFAVFLVQITYTQTNFKSHLLIKHTVFHFLPTRLWFCLTEIRPNSAQSQLFCRESEDRKFKHFNMSKNLSPNEDQQKTLGEGRGFSRVIGYLFPLSREFRGRVIPQYICLS